MISYLWIDEQKYMAHILICKDSVETIVLNGFVNFRCHGSISLSQKSRTFAHTYMPCSLWMPDPGCDWNSKLKWWLFSNDILYLENLWNLIKLEQNISSVPARAMTMHHNTNIIFIQLFLTPNYLNVPDKDNYIDWLYIWTYIAGNKAIEHK